MPPTRLCVATSATVAAASLAASAFAAGPPPVSYDMLNGNTGSYQYWDESYSGSGCLTCDNAALSGGRGDLTDGVVAIDNWDIVEAPAGNGPYVGWKLDPTIVFHWAAPVAISSVTFHFDDADGLGGVSAPAGVDIGAASFAIADPAGSAPFAFTVGGLSFTGTDLAITLHRRDVWVFLSEVEFNAAAVPEPASWATLAAGLGVVGALGARSRRRRG